MINSVGMRPLSVNKNISFKSLDKDELKTRFQQRLVESANRYIDNSQPFSVMPDRTRLYQPERDFEQNACIQLTHRLPNERLRRPDETETINIGVPEGAIELTRLAGQQEFIKQRWCPKGQPPAKPDEEIPLPLVFKAVSALNGNLVKTEG